MIIEKFQRDNYFKVYPTAWDVTDNGCVGLIERERERERGKIGSKYSKAPYLSLYHFRVTFLHSC